MILFFQLFVWSWLFRLIWTKQRSTLCYWFCRFCYWFCRSWFWLKDRFFSELRLNKYLNSELIKDCSDCFVATAPPVVRPWATVSLWTGTRSWSVLTEPSWAVWTGGAAGSRVRGSYTDSTRNWEWLMSRTRCLRWSTDLNLTFCSNNRGVGQRSAVFLTTVLEFQNFKSGALSGRGRADVNHLHRDPQRYGYIYL